ncbi:hypothetical protein D3C87_1315510 [compost metagenome]
MILTNCTPFLKNLLKYISILLFWGCPLLCFSQYKLKDTTKFVTNNLPAYVYRLDQYKYKNIPVIDRKSIVSTLLREYYIDELVSGNETLSKDRYYALSHHLSAKTFNSLNNRDRFNYCMMTQEFYMQNCGSLGRFKSTGIYGAFYRSDLPLEYWSDRQLQFLHKNRKEIIGYVDQMWSDLKFIGNNTKDLLVELIMWEEIPNILQQIELSPQDNSLYSVLVQIMMRAKFTTFEASKIYEQLYGPESYIASQIAGTEENRTAIVDMAKKCYAELDVIPNYNVPIYVRQSKPSYSSDGLKEELVTRKKDWPLKKVQTPIFKIKL